MERRFCGSSGLQLSVLGLGCWEFGGGEYWGPHTQAEADSVVRAAFDEGITYFDTAEAYNDGRSEQALGKALKSIPRNEVVIGTKVSPSNAYRNTLIDHCESSLKRLGTDYIDLYMVHWPTTPHSIRHFTNDSKKIGFPPSAEETFESLSRLTDAGKILHSGVSNFGMRPFSEALALEPRIAVNQLPYNLLCRAIELEVLPALSREGVGVIGYFTLLQGILTEKYPGLSDVPKWQRRIRHFDSADNILARHGGAGVENETQAALDRIREIALSADVPISTLAIRWAISNAKITCALVGSRSPQRIRENARDAARPLDHEVVAALNEATRPVLEKLGNGFDYYESADNDRTQ